jgi:RNA polymerase sigma-70 factor (ECF subfamily)
MHPDPHREDAIRAELMRGDATAVEVVRGWVSGLVRGGGWGLADPEGAVQDAVERLLQLAKDGRIRTDTDFKSFVMTVARHTCIDLYRRERLRRASERPGVDPDSTTSRGDDPETSLLKRERKQILRFVFQALSDECRRLWRLVYGEGLTPSDVAAQLGISATNARVRLHRCLQRARQIRTTYVPVGGVGRGFGV